MRSFNPTEHLIEVYQKNHTQLSKYDTECVFVGHQLNENKSYAERCDFFINVICRHLPEQNRYKSEFLRFLNINELNYTTINLVDGYSTHETDFSSHRVIIKPSEAPLKIHLDKTVKSGKQSSYTKLFGEDLVSIRCAELITSVHATKISQGTKLEHWIYEDFSGFKDEKIKFENVLHNIYNHPNRPQLYRSVEFSVGLILNSDEEFDRQNNIVLDFLHYNPLTSTLSTFETKDGGELDTKNSNANIVEVRLINRVVSFQVVKNSMEDVVKHIVSKLVGFSKDLITNNDIKVHGAEELTITGKDFCEFIGISYENIVNRMKEYNKGNREVLLNEMEEILKMEGRI